MSEIELASKILDTIWKLEKIAIDFHSKRIFKKQFMKEFSDVALELTLNMIELHRLPTKKEG
ncbi:hypothetical protein ES703_16579 [subsurface metagenome]